MRSALEMLPFGPSSARALPHGWEATRALLARGTAGLAKLRSARMNVLPVAVLACAGMAAVAIADFAFGSAAERALAKRLDELSAQVSILEQAARANGAALAEHAAKTTSLNDAVGRLEAKQAQTDALLAKLAKDMDAPRGAAAPAAAIPAAAPPRTKRCTSLWCEMQSAFTRRR